MYMSPIKTELLQVIKDIQTLNNDHESTSNLKKEVIDLQVENEALKQHMEKVEHSMIKQLV